MPLDMLENLKRIHTIFSLIANPNVVQTLILNIESESCIVTSTVANF